MGEADGGKGVAAQAQPRASREARGLCHPTQGPPGEMQETSATQAAFSPVALARSNSSCLKSLR